MARISRSALTKLEIIQAACRNFLENGYTNTSVKMICNELGMSTGNLTFYFPTKEHLLDVLVDLLCEFQWKLMEEEAQEGYSSVMAICLELTTMAVACEEDAITKDFYLSAYSGPITLATIRRNDVKRAQEVFRSYRPDWDENDFAEAEILVSGIEYAILMTTDDGVSLEKRIAGALGNILGIFGVPPEIRDMKIAKVLALDYREIGRRTLKEFKEYVEQANEQAFLDLLKS